MIWCVDPTNYIISVLFFFTHQIELYTYIYVLAHFINKWTSLPMMFHSWFWKSRLNLSFIFVYLIFALSSEAPNKLKYYYYQNILIYGIWKTGRNNGNQIWLKCPKFSDLPSQYGLFDLNSRNYCPLMDSWTFFGFLAIILKTRDWNFKQLKWSSIQVIVC